MDNTSEISSTIEEELRKALEEFDIRFNYSSLFQQYFILAFL